MTREWLADRQIVLFKVTSMAREDVDLWMNTVKETMLAWPDDMPYLAIHDLTGKGVPLTPYARARAEELIPIAPKTKGFAAIVMPRTFVG
jgi:hypothetical protein